MEEEVGLALGGGFGLGVQAGDLVVDAADFGFDRRGVLALRFEDADLLRGGFALVLELLFGGFRGAAGFIAGESLVDEFPMVAAAEFEAFADGVWVLADGADIEHGGGTFGVGRGWNQP